MDELSQRLKLLGEAVQYDGQPVEDGLRAIHETRHRRRRRNQAVAAAGVALAVVCVVAIGITSPWSTTEPVVSVQSAALRLGLGAEATPLSDATEVRVVAAQPGRLDVALDAGSARFAVEPDPSRVVRLAAGHVQIEVLGTEFTVARHPERVRVEVIEGRVRVVWAKGEQIMEGGAAAWFEDRPQTAEVTPEPPDEAPDDAPQEPEQAEAESPELKEEGPEDTPKEAAPTEKAPSKAKRWQALAKSGDYKAAYEAMKAAPVRDVPAELLLAADVARLSGHPGRAVPHLRRLVQRHPNDSRAGLAAFTLGRIYMSNLGKPAQAAQMFARAQRGALAQDALGREIQAWARAGNRAKAKVAAQRYLKRHPSGPWAATARQHAGEAPP